MKKYIYLVLAVIGIIGPYTQFVPWSMVHGADLARMFADASVNGIAAGIAIDAVLAACAFILFIFFDRKMSRVSLFWVPIVGIFVFGIAFAIPAYFFLRERALEQAPTGGASA